MWGHGAAEETVVLPWGATTSKAKSLNRATVGRISRSPDRTCQRAEASRVGAPALLCTEEAPAKRRANRGF
jgi:hypothetical protein